MRETTYKKIWKQIISCCLISSIVMTGTGIQTAAESVQPHLSMEVKSEKVAVNEEVAVEETNKEVTVGAEILKLRKEYSKTYEQSDGTNLTILSAAPFHYYDKKAKKWKDINNDLKKKEKKNGDIVYQNRKSDFEVELPKDMDQESQIKASYQGYRISVQLSDVSKSKGVTDNGTDKRPKIKLKEGVGQEAVIVSDALSEGAIVYEDAFVDTDVQYTLSGNALKEFIKLSEKPDALISYEYIIDAGKLQAKLWKDGSVCFLNEDKATIFVLPAPYMYDANNIYSAEIETKMEKKGGKIILTYIPSLKWLKSEETTYPVVIDPTVQTSVNSGIEDTWVSRSNPEENYGNSNTFVTGNTVDDVMYAYLKFSRLPELPNMSSITEAKVHLSSPCSSSGQFAVRKVLTDWDESKLTYENQPEVSDVISSSSPSDITSILEDWYRNGNQFGIQIAPHAVRKETSMPAIYFSSEDTVSTRVPYLTISYTTVNHLSDVQVRELDMGRAGIVAINDFTGGVTIQREEIGVDGNVMPVSITMLTDSQVNGSKSISVDDTSCFGKDTRTNYSECITHTYSADGNKYYTYVDGNGKTIYFDWTEVEKKDDDGNVISTSYQYVDAMDSGYTLTCDMASPNSYTKVVITDEDSYSHLFDSYGRLVKIANTGLPVVKNAGVTATSGGPENGVISIKYKDKTSMKVATITDGVGRIYAFYYNTSGLLSDIAYKGTGNSVLKKVSYTYNSSKTLQDITYQDGKKISYVWGQDSGKVEKVTDTDGRYYKFGYINNSIPRLQSIKAYGSLGTVGVDVSIKYSSCSTIYKDNMTGQKEILQFNKKGDLLNTHDADGRVVVNQYAESKVNTKIPNQLVRTSGLTNASANFVQNSRAQLPLAVGIWKQKGNCRITSEHSCYGGKSFQLTGVESAETSLKQNISVKKGQSYTFSAYAKTEGVEVPGAKITASSTNITVVKESVALTGDTDWRRISTTFAANTDTNVTLALVLNNTEGTAYFDGIQCEYGSVAGDYNYIENSGFEKGTIGWSFSGVLGDATTVSSEKATYSVGTVNPNPGGVKYIQLNGDPRYKNSVSNAMLISGVKGDTYTFGAWAKADSVAGSEDRTFRTVIQFYNGTIKVGEDQYVEFNQDLAEWQYGLSTVTAEGDYTRIIVLGVYDYQSNSACFSGFQLNRDNFDEDYEDTTGESNEDEEENFEDIEIKDDYDRITESVEKNGIITRNSYDIYNNQISQSIQDSETSILTDRTFSGDGNYEISSTDELGNVSKNNYNMETGIRNQCVDAKNNVKYYEYNSYGDVTKVYEEVSGLLNGSQIINMYIYDSGNRLSIIKHNGFQYQFGYDEFGVLKNVKAGSHTLENYTYGVDYELKKIEYGNGQEISYGYDERGNQTAVYYNGRLSYKYFYDESGHVIYVKDYNNQSSISYTTDAEGNTITNYGGMKLGGPYEYYTKDNTFYEKIPSSKSPRYELRKTCYSDEEKKKKTFWSLDDSTFSNEEKIFDNFGRVSDETIYLVERDSYGKEISASKDTIVSKSFEYLSPVNGRTSNVISKLNISSKDGYSKTLSYTYDKNGNITNDGISTYTYDSANQLTSEINNKTGVKYTYIYDVGGNIQDVKVTHGTTTLVNRKYTYDSDWKDLLVSYQGKAITYDEIGNPTDYYNGTKFTWKMGRQLAEVVKNDGTHINYQYNQDGIRTIKMVGDITTKYSTVGGKITSQDDGENRLYFYYNSNNELVSFELNGIDYYYVKNLQGDIIAIVDKTGVCVTEYTYTAFGDCTVSGELASTVGKINPFRYRSYYFDAETNLYYLESRYYDSQTGRFINADNIEILCKDSANLLQQNLFAYCFNNPMNYVDPSGYASKPVPGPGPSAKWRLNYGSVERQKAINYCKKYYKGHNRKYKKFSGDCANFVSQCLYTAWGKTLGNWSPGIFHRLLGKGTRAWQVAKDQYNYFNRSNFIRKSTIKITKKSQIDSSKTKNVKKGDLLYWANSKGVHHSTIITSNSGKLKFGGHTNPAYNKSVKDSFNGTLYIVRLKDRITIPYNY